MSLVSMAQTTNSDYAPDEAAFAKARRSAIGDAVLQAHHEVKGETEQKRVLRSSSSSQYYQLLREIAEAAQAFAISNQQTVDRFDFGILQDAIRVCESVHSAFHLPYLSAEAMEIPELRAAKSRDRPTLVWQHVNDLDHRTKIGDVPYLDRQLLLEAVGQYLNLPIKSQRMDRILIDGMIASEMLAIRHPTFADLGELAKKYKVTDWASEKMILFQRGLLSIAFSIFFFGGVVAAAFYLASVDVFSYSQPSWVRVLSAWFSPETWKWIGSACSVLMFFRFAKAVVRWRKELSEVANNERRATDLSVAVSTTYDELASPGPASAARVRELATKAAEKGATWPPPLFALLDDVVARSGHIG
jgi:hypothetical protein